MTRIILCGCNGKMGKVITDCLKNDENCEIVAGVDLEPVMNGNFPVFTSIEDVNVEADAIIDFSHPSLLQSLLEYSKANSVPAVIATTGLSDEQVQSIKKYSEQTALFFSFNMSLGINLLTGLAKKAAAILNDKFDIEIIEKHHNQKIDAPSGTAIMIAEEINSTLNNAKTYKYDRHSTRAKRAKNEIGIHSIRGGTIVGEHDVIFAGHDEVITLSHSAASKEVFATGAIKAAVFLSKKSSGLYDMTDLINE